MAETLKGYKVVRRNLKSCWVVGHAEMEYEPGLWTHRRLYYGPLAVFRTKIRAVQFMQDNEYGSTLDLGDRELRHCKYVPSKDVELWYIDDEGETEYRSSLPCGTCLADSVMLGEKVL